MKNEQANRCLQCKNARCQAACPVHTSIPEVIGLYKQDALEEAGKILFSNNPLSAITSLVCDHQKVCFGHCVLNAKKAPIPFYEMEQEISLAYLPKASISCAPANGKKIGVIGAGPAGITIAMGMAQKGYAVTLFEKEEKIGGVLRYGIPEFRLKKTLVDELERILVECRVDIQTKRADVLPKDLLKEGYQAVFVGVGVSHPHTLGIPGEDLPHVHYAIDYLKDPSAYSLGKNVIVIGGGNVAMDAARTAVRSGVPTSIYYRKTFADMPSNPIEVEEAKEDGVDFQVYQAPVSTKQGETIFCDCKTEVDENGKKVTKIIEGTQHPVACDTLIIAASQSADLEEAKAMGIECTCHGLAQADQQGRTNLPGVFASGDFVFGAKTVVEAVAGAKVAVEAMDAYCKEETK